MVGKKLFCKFKVVFLVNRVLKSSYGMSIVWIFAVHSPVSYSLLPFIKKSFKEDLTILPNPALKLYFIASNFEN